MATQPLYRSYNPPVQFPVKPNIRVVFSAGDAAVAVRGVLAELPVALRAATLDEIAIKEATAALIEDAKGALSAPMYRAFLNWGAAAAAFETDRDEELSDGLCATCMEALREVSAVPARSAQDSLFKSWLLTLEVSDSPAFGPLRFRPQDAGFIVNSVAEGMGGDFAVLSPLVANLERLSIRAAMLAPSEHYSFTTEVGSMIIAAFSEAAQRQDLVVDQAVSWNTAMSAYLAAEHLCDVMPVDDPDADNLVDTSCEAMDYLIEKVRAPSLAALSIKLDLALGRSEWFEDVLFDDHARGIIADIRHLANAPLPADPHASWLADRNLALLKVNRATAAQLSEELASEQCSIATALEGDIAATPAESTSGVIAKLALIVQTALEGSSPDPDWCASALMDARRVTGIGSLDAAADARHREMAA